MATKKTTTARAFPKPSAGKLRVEPVDVQYAYHGADLREAIERAGYSLTAFANELDLHISRVSYYCRDVVRVVSSERLCEFEAALQKPQQGGKPTSVANTVTTKARDELNVQARS